jgi:hypothetical protein
VKHHLTALDGISEKARAIFGLALLLAVLDLFLLMFVVFIQDSEISNIFYYISVIISIVLSILFFIGILYVQRFGPIRIKMMIHADLVSLEDDVPANDNGKWEARKKKYDDDLKLIDLLEDQHK